MNRHIPSKAMLHRMLGSSMGERAYMLNNLRHLLEDWKKGDISSRDMMTEANGILDGHGVEFIRSEDNEANAYYVNMGDTYEPTVLLDLGRDKVWATSWGDWLEAEERAGHTFR